MIPRGEAEFRRHLQDRGVAETRGEGSDETEVMGTEPTGEPDRGKSARAVETAEDVDVPEEPGDWDSGSERGDDLEFEHDEEAEEARSDPGDEERLKTRGGAHTTRAYGGVVVIHQSEIARYTREVADG